MRLIDADVFLKRFSVTEDGRKIPEVDCDNFEVTVSIKDVKAMIREQPTAYDIDKVVEKLRCDRCESCSFLEVCSGSKCCTECHNKIIEIVKQGGVADDVCEWRLCDEEANVYDTSCRNPHILIEGTPKENNYEYCPYCGKKIKAVE